MSEDTLLHTPLYGIEEYTSALDTLCKLVRKELYLFDKNFDNLGFNSEARYETLHQFLHSNPSNRLFMLAHDTHYLATCPRMMSLLRQFSNSMMIYQLPVRFHDITEAISIADSTHYLRRFHFNDPRGILAQHDPEIAHALKARFMEMWAVSNPSSSTKQFAL